MKEIGSRLAGKVNILINNAGVGGAGKNAAEAKWEECNKVMMTDLIGVMKFTNGVIPLLKVGAWGCEL